MSAIHEKDRFAVARLGATVLYQELPAGPSRRVTVVGPRDADAGAGRISVLSPIGRALLGRRTGQVTEVELPMGRTIAVRVAEVVAATPADVDAEERSYA